MSPPIKNVPLASAGRVLVGREDCPVAAVDLDLVTILPYSVCVTSVALQHTVSALRASAHSPSVNACTTTSSTLFVGARSKRFPNGNRGRLSWSNRKVACCDRQNRPQKFFKNIEVPFALDLLSIWADNGFRRIRCCQGFHTSKLVASVVLRGRLAGLILAKSTLSHVLSAAMPIKKTTSARLPPLETFPTRNRA